MLKEFDLVKGQKFDNFDNFLDAFCKVKFKSSIDRINGFSDEQLTKLKSQGITKEKLGDFVKQYYIAYCKSNNVADEVPIDKAIEKSLEAIISRSNNNSNLPDVTITYEAKAGDKKEEFIAEELKGYSIRKLSKDDLRGYYLGALTNCCQSMHGHGRDFALLGMNDPNSGFYVLEKGGKPVGQALAWLSMSGKTMVLDSLEMVGTYLQAPAVMLFSKLAETIAKDKAMGVERVSLGLGGQTPNIYIKDLLNESVLKYYPPYFIPEIEKIIESEAHGLVTHKSFPDKITDSNYYDSKNQLVLSDDYIKKAYEDFSVQQLVLEAIKRGDINVIRRANDAGIDLKSVNYLYDAAKRASGNFKGFDWLWS